jgi:hypothetical protein
MSRRHKETEETKQHPPQHPHDQSLNGKRFTVSSKEFSYHLLALARIVRTTCHFDFLPETTEAEDVAKAVRSVLQEAEERRELEVGNKWVKVARKHYDVFCGVLDTFLHTETDSPPEESPHKRGAPRCTQLFRHIADSKVMGFFRRGLDKVQQACKAIYEDIKQYAVAFLHAAHSAFTPGETADGKLSHYYEMIKKEVKDFPAYRTLANKNTWYILWRPILYNEKPAEARARIRHGRWKQLEDYIAGFLRSIAPEYCLVAAG